MNLSAETLARHIGAVLVHPGSSSATVTGAYTCDLLSDVIANAPEGSVLITVLNHPNVIAVCVAADLPALLVCKNRAIPPETESAAAREGIALLTTPMNAFEASVAVFRALEDAAP